MTGVQTCALPILDLFGGVGGGTAGVAVGDTQRAILSQNHALRGRVEELSVTVTNSFERVFLKMGTLHKVVQRYANRPAQINRGFVGREHNNNNDDNGDNENRNDRAQENYQTTLSKQPKDMYKMWEEYEFGLEGRKAARKFNLRERGKNRYTYHRRKVVWDRIAELIKRGHTYLSACDNLYEQYGRDLSITKIINIMRNERSQRNG